MPYDKSSVCENVRGRAYRRRAVELVYERDRRLHDQTISKRNRQCRNQGGLCYWYLNKFTGVCECYYCRWERHEYTFLDQEAASNPGAYCRLKWRQEYRTRSNRDLRNCQDWDTLQFFPMHKVTNLWDWY